MMDLLPNKEELELAETVAELFRRVVPREALRSRAIDSNSISNQEWAACAETGIFGLAVAEDDGGAGFGPVEEVLAFREIGRELPPGPFLSTVIAAHLTADLREKKLCADIIGGNRRVGLLSLGPQASLLDDGYLNGRVRLIDSDGADLVLLLTPEFQGLYSLGDLGDLNRVSAVDPGLRLEESVVEGARPIMNTLNSTVYWRAVILASAMLTGVAEATRDASTLHAKTREQFGRPIGVNQAIKHRCADMAVAAEAATAQLFYTAAAFAEGLQDTPYQASVAKIVAAKAAIGNAEGNIQVHGGMGYTWEHDAHLYLKRARAWSSLLGGRASHLASVLQSEREVV